jgi:hypothetical protein
MRDTQRLSQQNRPGPDFPHRNKKGCVFDRLISATEQRKGEAELGKPLVSNRRAAV